MSAPFEEQIRLQAEHCQAEIEAYTRVLNTINLTPSQHQMYSAFLYVYRYACQQLERIYSQEKSTMRDSVYRFKGDLEAYHYAALQKAASPDENEVYKAYQNGLATKYGHILGSVNILLED